MVCLKTFSAWVLGGSNSFSQKCQGLNMGKILRLLSISQQMTFTTNSGCLLHSVHLVLRENCFTQASETFLLPWWSWNSSPHLHLFTIWLGKFNVIISQHCSCDFNTVSPSENPMTTSFSDICVLLIWPCRCRLLSSAFPSSLHPC